MGSRPMSVDEYSRLPEGDGVDELHAGLRVSEPRPLPRHGRIQVRLGRLLDAHASERRLGVVLSDAGFLLAADPDTVRGPDVAFVRLDRYDPEKEAHGFFRGAPDLAVEIVSPSNDPAELHGKVADFLAAGAKLVWVIDPERRCADVYRTLLAPKRVPVDGVLDGEEVVPGFSVKVSELLDF